MSTEGNRCSFCLTLRVSANNSVCYLFENFPVNHEKRLSRKGFALVEILKGVLCLSEFLLNQNKKGPGQKKNDVYINQHRTRLLLTIRDISQFFWLATNSFEGNIFCLKYNILHEKLGTCSIVSRK